MIEAKPLPELALTAVKLATDRHNALLNDIAQETLQVMGLSPVEGWKMNLDIACATREVADSQDQSQPAGSETTQPPKPD